MGLFLVYINYVGLDYRDNHIYEFIFSDTIKDVDGEQWDNYPAAGRPKPPYPIFIKEVGKLESELNLDVVQKSSVFAVWDAIDDVIALAWENMDDYETYPDKRLAFKFGETKESVEAKLYEKDLRLVFKDLKKHEKTKQGN